VLQLLSDLLSSRQEQLNAASDEERKDDYVLNERVILCSSQLLQLIAIRTGSDASSIAKMNMYYSETSPGGHLFNKITSL